MNDETAITEDEAYDALYPKRAYVELSPEDQAIYDAVYDWSNVPIEQRPPHARPANN